MKGKSKLADLRFIEVQRENQRLLERIVDIKTRSKKSNQFVMSDPNGNFMRRLERDRIATDNRAIADIIEAANSRLPAHFEERNTSR